MKYSILFLALFFSMSTGNAQYKWCVSMLGKTKLKQVEENREGNIVMVTTAELNKTGWFEIKFNKYDTAMRRTVFVNDASGSSMQNWEEVKKNWRISTEALKKLFDKGGELSFYFTEIPRDINKAMVIKVRPLHLCMVKRSEK